jgi:hypothetical protein
MSTRSAAAAARAATIAAQAAQADAERRARRILGEREEARTLVCALEVTAGTHATPEAAAEARGWRSAQSRK